MTDNRYLYQYFLDHTPDTGGKSTNDAPPEKNQTPENEREAKKNERT